MFFSLAACGGAEIKPAENGILTIDLENAAIVVNGTSVPMPYRLGELESAGVPTDESRKEIELAAGDFFSANLFLDENEDYVISPAYYNGGDDTINIADAQAGGDHHDYLFRRTCGSGSFPSRCHLRHDKERRPGEAR